MYVDSGYGITCLYPDPLRGELNRLGFGDEQSIPFKVKATTIGLESLVAIVVKSQGQPVDFSLLEQPSLSQARQRGIGESVLESPLGQLFRTSMYGEGSTRGVPRNPVPDYGVEVLSWRIER